MKRIFCMLLCAALMACACAYAEEEAGLSIDYGAETTGPFDEAALTNPEARYPDYVEDTDGSETMIFAMLDFFNLEQDDIDEYGALTATENLFLDENGQPQEQMAMVLQDSPFGTMVIMDASVDDVTLVTYACGEEAFFDMMGSVSPTTLPTMDYEYFIDSYHFPYGSLDALNGIRQDENGYTYLLIRSDETMSFEFVVGSHLRIEQLRVYVRGEDGALSLTSYVDYDRGPAREIPQAVLDAFAEVLPEKQAG